MSIEKGFHCLEGMDPSGKGVIQFRITSKQIDHLQRYGPAHVYYGIKSAAEVMKSPSIVYEGLRREKLEHGLCYCGIPRRYLNEGIEAPSPPRKVFAVYINEDGVVFEWRWDQADEFDLSVPSKAQERFERIKWKAQ